MHSDRILETPNRDLKCNQLAKEGDNLCELPL
jgi:hypothetical protein